MLIQGTNAPITIEFDDDTSSILDISVALAKENRILIKWGKSDVVFDGKFVYCPLEQAQTVNLPTGLACLEIKWTNPDGEVHFSELNVVRIEKRLDGTILVEV